MFKPHEPKWRADLMAPLLMQEYIKLEVENKLLKMKEEATVAIQIKIVQELNRMLAEKGQRHPNCDRSVDIPPRL